MAPSAPSVTRLFTTHRRSLVVRLALFGLLIVMLGTASRLMVLLPFVKDRLTELSSEHLLSIAQYAARDIDAKILRRQRFLRNLSASLPATLLSDPQGLEAWLKDRQDIDPLFSGGLVVVAADGSRAVDYPAWEGRRRLSFRDSDWFARALQGRGVVLGRPLRGRLTGRALLVMAAPVYDAQGRLRAVLAGSSALAAPGFLDALQETPIGRGGGFQLVSPHDHLFVAATDPAEVLAPLPPSGIDPLGDRAMAGFRGIGVATNAAGVRELSAVASIPSAGWFLVARVPVDEALGVLSDVRAFLFRGGTLTSAATIVIITLVLRRYLRPLVSASRQIHRMAAGEIPLQPVPVVERDEVGDLAQGFNMLLERLEVATAEKVAAERARAAESERLESMRRQWMADTSHELRTPISVLRAQIEALQDGVHAVDSRRLDLLHGEVMGLSRLVDDLHLLARSDVGQLDCRRDPVDPLGLLDDSVSVFRARYAAAGLGLDWTPPDGPPPVVAGDPVRLRQVFTNLMENSMRYTDPGGCLRISYGVAEGVLAIRYDDTAPAPPPDAMPRLFERFYRADGSRSRERGGTGIGLALCRSLVEAHGGAIAAGPSDLGGLGVSIHLPCIGGKA